MLRVITLLKASLVGIALLGLSAEPVFAHGGGGGGGGGGGHGGGGFGGGGGFHGGSFGGGYRGGGYAGGYRGGYQGSVNRGFSTYGQANASQFSGFNRGNTGEVGRNEFNSGLAGANNGFNNGFNRTGQFSNYYYGRGSGGWNRYGYGLGYGGWGLGWGWPWIGGWGWDLDWGYPYGGYGYYYGDDNPYYYSYNQPDYGYLSADDTGSTAIADSNTAKSATAQTTAATTADDQQAQSEGLEFYSQAREAFEQGDYHKALRLAGHAAVDAPNNPKVHELISLALFSLGNYTAAASEAHAASALGPIASWPELYGYYNNVDAYTSHLRALEKASREHPNDAAEHFLLGCQYLMTGARDNAKTELAQAVKLTPKDKLAAYYERELQSNSPLTPPEIANRPTGAPR